MKKVIALALATNMAASIAATSPKDLLEKSVNGMVGYSDQVVMMVGEEIKYQTGISEFDHMIDDFQDSEILNDSHYRASQRLSKFETSFNRVQNAYSNLETTHAGLTFTKYMVKGLVMGGSAAVGTAIAPGVGTAIGISIAETIADGAIEGTWSYLGGEAQKNTSAAMARFLKEELGEEKEYLLRNLTPENAKEVMETFAIQEQLEKKMLCKECSPEQNRLMTNMALSNLSNIVKGNTGAINQLKGDLDLTNEQVQVNVSKIANLADDLNDFKRITNDSISNLQQGQKQINEKLQTLQGKVDQNSSKIAQNANDIKQNAKDIKFMKDFMYGQMSPKQKLKAINSGVYGENFKKEKIELIKLQAGFQENVGNLVNGGNQIATIASNLGVKLPKEFNEALSFGNKAYSSINGAMTAILNGQYLGAVAALTNLFGKKRDVGAERHAQVMKALGVINKKLDVVLANQEEMLKNQKQIMENQRSIYAKLIDIEQLVIKSSQLLFDRIELTREDIAQNRKALLGLIKKSYNNCNIFVHKTKKIMNLTDLPLTAYQKRNAYFRTTSDKEVYKNCINMLSQMSEVRDSDSFSAQFHLGMQTADGAISYAENIKEHYDVLYNFYSKLIQDKKRAYINGLIPAQNVLALKDLVKQIQNESDINRAFNAEEWQNYHGSMLNVEALIKEPLFFESVMKAANLINDFYFYLDIVDDGKMMPLEDIINGYALGKASNGYSILKDVKTHLNIALLQTSLMSGQLMIPEIYKKLEDASLIVDLNNVLKKSPTIEQNFLTYLIFNKQKEFADSFRKTGLSWNKSCNKVNSLHKRSGKGFFNRGHYSIALEMKNVHQLKKVLGVTEKTIYQVECKEKCKLVIGEARYDLPAMQDLNGGEFIIHPLAKKLAALKSLTSENMGSYTIHRDMNEQNELDAKNYRLLLIKSARALPKNK